MRFHRPLLSADSNTTQLQLHSVFLNAQDAIHHIQAYHYYS